MSPIHVVAGVIYDSQRHILLARRPEHLHQGGLWEFPGGKVDAGELIIPALRRELNEELGITLTRSQPLIQVHQDYGDKQVWLDVHEVLAYSGNPHGREGQAVQWVNRDALSQHQFPAANLPVVRSLELPSEYLITGEFRDSQDCLRRAERALQQGVRLLQFRAKHLASPDYIALSVQLRKLCDRYHATLIANIDPALFNATQAHGLQLTSVQLMTLYRRPVDTAQWLFASVHNQTELLQAKKLGADAVVIAPIKHTLTHSDAHPLGWAGLEQLATQANCPVYALGGIDAPDLPKVRAHGAQGVAGISAFWPAGAES